MDEPLVKVEGAPLAKAEEALISALGRQSAFWGLGKTAGEIYAVLYLATGPVSLEEIARRLHLTKGNISIAIRQLERLAMVRRSWQTGDRRVFFEAETDPWKIGRSVLALRQKPEFDLSFTLIEEGARLAEAAAPSAARDQAVARLAALREFYQVLDGLVAVALALSPAQLKAAAGGLKGMLGVFQSGIGPRLAKRGRQRPAPGDGYRA